MLLAFASAALRKLCETEEKAIATFGIETTARLKRRVADMRAVDFADNLPAGKNAIVKGGFVDHMSLEIGGNMKIIFCANHNDNPVLKNGRINWAQVSRVKIVQVGNPHD